MNFNMAEAVSGEYMTKNDVTTTGMTATIAGITQEKVGQEQEDKYALHFTGGFLKPMVLNKTNINILRALYGDNSDGWVGKQINVFNDPTISYGGQITGGVRLRMVTPEPVAQPVADMNDSIPAAFDPTTQIPGA